MNNIFYNKYIKYKNKYINLKHINNIQKGGIKDCNTENPMVHFKIYIWEDIYKKLYTIDNRYL
jgi:hypothetical protein